MRVNGEWLICEDGMTRPTITGVVRTSDDRVVEAEIDEIGAIRLRPHEAQDAPACRLAYKRAAPDLAAYEAAALGLGIGAAHRADGDVQAPGEIAVGR